MDEEAEIGYMFARTSTDPSNLEIKVLTKKYAPFVRKNNFTRFFFFLQLIFLLFPQTNTKQRNFH